LSFFLMRTGRDWRLSGVPVLGNAADYNVGHRTPVFSALVDFRPSRPGVLVIMRSFL